METVTQASLFLTQLNPAKNRKTIFGVEDIDSVVLIAGPTLLALLYSRGDPQLSHDCPRGIELESGRERDRHSQKGNKGEREKGRGKGKEKEGESLRSEACRCQLSHLTVFCDRKNFIYFISFNPHHNHVTWTE